MKRTYYVRKSYMSIGLNSCRREVFLFYLSIRSLASPSTQSISLHFVYLTLIPPLHHAHAQRQTRIHISTRTFTRDTFQYLGFSFTCSYTMRQDRCNTILKLNGASISQSLLLSFPSSSLYFVFLLPPFLPTLHFCMSPCFVQVYYC